MYLKSKVKLYSSLPGILITTYLGLTIALFFFGPVQWNSSNVNTTMAFLAFAIILFGIFYWAGLSIPSSPLPIFPQRNIVVFGSLLSLLMLFPSAYFYADKMPWELVSAIQDQRLVYEALQKRLSKAQSGREVIAFARALTFPFIYAVVPLYILNFQRNPKWFWMLFGLTMASAIIFSILRGTDRESFDFILLVASSTLILTIRNSSQFLNRNKIKAALAVGLTAIIITILAYNVFGERRLQRAGLSEQALTQLLDTPGPQGGYMTIMCIRAACADKNHWMIASASAFNKYAITMVSNYLTNGYYGLSLALADPSPFNSTLGIGHAPALKRIYERITQDESLYKNSYTFHLNSKAWSDNSEWATIFPWLANDVGFEGALLVFGLFGFIFAISWKDATQAHNDVAAIVFCFLVQLLVYVPANFQIGQTLDSYFGFVFWLVVWIIFRNRAH